MAKPPRLNARGQWVIDLPEDRLQRLPDGSYVLKLVTTDMRPGGALYGVTSKGGAYTDLVLGDDDGTSIPEAVSVGLELPDDPDDQDRAIGDEWVMRSDDPDYVAGQTGIARPGEPLITVIVDAERIEQRDDGEFYLQFTDADFANVPAETLAYWRSRGDLEPDRQIPIRVHTRGKHDLPEGKALRMQMPSGGVLPARRRGIPSVTGGASPALDLFAALQCGEVPAIRSAIEVAGAPALSGDDVAKLHDALTAEELAVFDRYRLSGSPEAKAEFDAMIEGVKHRRDDLDALIARLNTQIAYTKLTGYDPDGAFETAMDVVGASGDRRGVQRTVAAIDAATPKTVTINARTFQRVDGKGREAAPTLSDQLMFQKDAFIGSIPRKLQEAIKSAHRGSRAFVFDRAASYRVGEICSYAPDLIADQQEFARCPYPKTFIELDAGALIKAMTDAGLQVYTDDKSPADDRLGFLFTERGIYTAYSGPLDQSLGGSGYAAGWSPIAYRPHQPMTEEQRRRFMADLGATSVDMVDQWLWGNAYDILDRSRRRSLRAQHGLDVLFPADIFRGAKSPLRGLLRGGGAGDLKVALCCSLLLIRPNMLNVTETRAAGRKLVMGRPTTFLAHRVVTITLDADRLRKRVIRACKEERVRHKARWHEVRGHYMHNHRAKVADCIHDWREVDPLKWECARGCGGRRAWRTYPEGRGDASIGVVTKHYVVKP